MPGTDLETFPLCLGGNVFGWTVEERGAFAVLDAFVEAGGTMVDTADAYTAWVSEESTGGESEELIGRWLASRGNRDEIVVATKVGRAPGTEGLAADTIRRGVEASLRRLGTDRIDLYYAHADDPGTPLEETLATFDALVREGKVRYIAASNFTAERLEASLAVSDTNGLARYVAVQPHYNLVHRGDYEGALAGLCEREGLGCLPYFALASGFLTGKYRTPDVHGVSPREGRATSYVDDRGLALLAVLDEIAASHGTSVAAVSLAWLAAQPAVVAPIASARTPEQLVDLVTSIHVELSADELERLRAAA